MASNLSGRVEAPDHAVGASGAAAGPNGVADRRAIRREETRAAIVAAAWNLVRENGLAGLSMRDLGKAVGMRAASLYSYFGSKNEIYDALYHEGYTVFAETIAASSAELSGATPVERARAIAREFFGFCTSDPVRYQLLFQRTIPDFVPSQQSYEVAVSVLESLGAALAGMGVDDPAAVDLWTAVMTGMTSQQISNDPDGDRWERLLDRAVEMTLRETAPQLLEPDTKGPEETENKSGRKR